MPQRTGRRRRHKRHKAANVARGYLLHPRSRAEAEALRARRFDELRFVGGELDGRVEWKPRRARHHVTHVDVARRTIARYVEAGRSDDQPFIRMVPAEPARGR